MTLKSPNQVVLGCECKDQLTGLTGIVVSTVLAMNGSRQVHIQPPAKKDGTLADGFAHDIHQVIWTGPGVSASAIAPVEDTGIVLGNAVEDKVTGFKGIATKKSIFINGCVYYTVEAKLNKDGEAKFEFFDWQRLKVTGQGLAPKKAEPVTKAEKPGGPRMPAMRQK